ncbi:MAG: hypothetical protein KC590_07135 [Nitrospira sp.]|nr:hypothetical protein [Nitrospira sp.]
MEIHPFPSRTGYSLSLHAPSKSEDGDSSSSGNFYRRFFNSPQKSQDPNRRERVPTLDGSARIIDIRV